MLRMTHISLPVLGQASARSVSKRAAKPLQVLVAKDGVEVAGRARVRGERVGVAAGFMRNKLYPAGDAVYDTEVNRALFAREEAIEAATKAAAGERAAQAEANASAAKAVLEVAAGKGELAVALEPGRNGANVFGVAKAVGDGAAGDASLISLLGLPKAVLGQGVHEVAIAGSAAKLTVRVG
ncbi:uncharacterized protein AMSG_00270 [Thecamonas trahens ATCC 50062]|uniref:Ribosomal protein L9 domain-containing protein n=1 Tax=Thecamonas trahens ATCC 50062 TaxID=461836 RepID=A0A0L0D1M9_THETB|nr:hypothetical protein AMSG_00270 [Thecamonas trahens ATCC 50062]KNC46152.1 hypothetical protein AMSG_00270 [Thecamonas trahens ATCC 50062]|eukprot:XP_013763128.1 hypothetical protein AMSG_00270 [Thecamonas trahens ATCC 50062]